MRQHCLIDGPCPEIWWLINSMQRMFVVYGVQKIVTRGVGGRRPQSFRAPQFLECTASNCLYWTMDCDGLKHKPPYVMLWNERILRSIKYSMCSLRTLIVPPFQFRRIYLISKHRNLRCIHKCGFRSNELHAEHLKCKHLSLSNFAASIGTGVAV